MGFRSEICKCLSPFVYFMLLSDPVLLGCPNCVSVSSHFSRDYSAKCRRDIAVFLLFFFKGFSSDISFILRSYIASLNPHTQHRCLLYKEMVSLSEEKNLCMWVKWGDTVGADDSEGRMSSIATLSAVVPNNFSCSLVLCLFQNTSVRTPAILARCDKN